MAQPKPRPATYADIEALPPHVVGEILFGILHSHPRPGPRHAAASSAVGAELYNPFQRGRGGPGGWLFLDEPELHLGRHVIVPDIAAWRRERMPELPETAYIATSPDWVSEVLSPATRRVDRTDKLTIYAEFGIGHAWYIDPDARTLEVLALAGGKWVVEATYKDADPVSAPPFAEHTFTLDVLWPG